MSTNKACATAYTSTLRARSNLFLQILFFCLALAYFVICGNLNLYDFSLKPELV